MIPLTIITREDRVNEYLAEHGLMEGFVPLQAVVLQLVGTEEGKPCALLIAEIDGKKHVIKTSLRLLTTAAKALDGVAQQHLGPEWMGP